MALLAYRLMLAYHLTISIPLTLIFITFVRVKDCILSPKKNARAGRQDERPQLLRPAIVEKQTRERLVLARASRSLSAAGGNFPSTPSPKPRSSRGDRAIFLFTLATLSPKPTLTSIASVSANALKARRAQLKRRRQLKLLQAFWRLLLVSSMAGGLTWGLTQLNWTLERPEQIDVEGNRLLSPGAVRALLSLSYPQSLWQLQPQALGQQMESAPPIAEATVTRQLLPPGLTVTVKERQPVARVLDPHSQQETGYLDERGVFLPESSYARLLPNARLPQLQTLGIDDSLKPFWSEIYRAVRHSPVQVTVLDFRNPANSVLTTELGSVHLGQFQPGTPRLAQQLEVLTRMRELPSRVKTDRLAYIDLSNPELPTVQLR